MVIIINEVDESSEINKEGMYMEETYVLDLEELDIPVQEYLKTKGFAPEAQVEVSAYTDINGQVVTVILPL